MKKNALLIIGLAFFAIACKEKTKKTDTSPFTITAKLANNSFDGQMAYLQKPDSSWRSEETIDSVKIDKGQFVFKGNLTDSIAVRFVKVGAFRRSLFVLQPGNTDLSFDTIMYTTVKGSAVNELIQKMNVDQAAIQRITLAISKEFAKVQEKATPGQKSAFENAMKQEEDKYKMLIYNFIKVNISNPLGEYYLLNTSYLLDAKQLAELLPLTSDSFKKMKRVQDLEVRLKALQATAIGNKFVDIRGKDFEGKDVALSNYAGKGKVVMIDFWASWCGPCVRLMPEFIATYKLYKNKGFEIVSVSLDDNKDAWVKKAKQLGMTWPQMSNLKGWKEDGAVTYGVSSIPHTVLIDKEGTIVAVDLDGSSLNSKIEELLKK